VEPTTLTGLAGHELATIQGAEVHNVGADFYMKTLHSRDYWPRASKARSGCSIWPSQFLTSQQEPLMAHLMNLHSDRAVGFIDRHSTAERTCSAIPAPACSAGAFTNWPTDHSG
jgi:hypothetical protein